MGVLTCSLHPVLALQPGLILSMLFVVDGNGSGWRGLSRAVLQRGNDVGLTVYHSSMPSRVSP